MSRKAIILIWGAVIAIGSAMAACRKGGSLGDWCLVGAMLSVAALAGAWACGQGRAGLPGSEVICFQCGKLNSAADASCRKCGAPLVS